VFCRPQRLVEDDAQAAKMSDASVTSAANYTRSLDAANHLISLSKTLVGALTMPLVAAQKVMCVCVCVCVCVLCVCVCALMYMSDTSTHTVFAACASARGAAAPSPAVRPTACYQKQHDDNTFVHWCSHTPSILRGSMATVSHPDVVASYNNVANI